MLLIVVLGRGVPAWREWATVATSEAQTLTGEAEWAHQLVTSLPMLRDSARARRVRVENLSELLVAEGSPGAVSAAMSALVADAAVSAGVRLGAVEVRVDSGGPRARTGDGRAPVRRHYLRVWARIDLTTDVQGLMAMLAWLEENPPLLAVRELTINQPDPGASPERPEILRVAIAIEGLAQRPVGRTQPAVERAMQAIEHGASALPPMGAVDEQP
jgi:hypothetical protein